MNYTNLGKHTGSADLICLAKKQLISANQNTSVKLKAGGSNGQQMLWAEKIVQDFFRSVL